MYSVEMAKARALVDYRVSRETVRLAIAAEVPRGDAPLLGALFLLVGIAILASVVSN